MNNVDYHHSSFQVSGQSALMLAAENGHIKMVERLIKAEANVNLRHKLGNTALTLAAQYGHSQIVQLLMDSGADANGIDGKSFLQQRAV